MAGLSFVGMSPAAKTGMATVPPRRQYPILAITLVVIALVIAVAVVMQPRAPALPALPSHPELATTPPSPTH